MNLQELSTLVKRSTILTEEDRAYWLSSLPTMNDGQLQKLEHLLAQAETIPLEEHVRAYIRTAQSPLTT